MRNDYQLRKWLMKEIHGIELPRRKPIRKAIQKGPSRDWKYRAWIRSLPCAACGIEPAGEAAHTGSDGGMSQKSSDFSCIPLCPDCHTQAPDSYHRDRAAFDERVDVADWVRRLNRLWFHPQARMVD